jgi:SAM-dependent methyltransferase
MTASASPVPITAARLLEQLEAQRHLLEPFSYDFARRMYTEGIEKYKKRLVQAGFAGLDHILDAGSGTGQWSLAMAELCNQVTATDVLEGRVYLLDGLVKGLKVSNLRVECGSLHKIEKPDATFDGVFCYSVIDRTGDWRKPLRELLRVLKPGGKLYLTANGAGYYRYTWQAQPNKSEGHDPRKWAALAFYNTWRVEQGLDTVELGLTIIEPEALIEECKRLGLKDVVQAEEGQYVVPGFTGEKGQSFAKGSYLGDTAMYEIIGTKA